MRRVRITIDELVLEGVTHIDRAQLVEAIQQALAQQAAAGNVPSPVTIPRVRREVDGLTAETAAGQIARAVYGGRK
jgi:translation initiation factor IF-2